MKGKRRPAAAGKRPARSAAAKNGAEALGKAGREGSAGARVTTEKNAPGRPRAYGTAEELAEAVTDYFESISRTVDAVEMVDSGRRDDSGHVICEPVKITNDAGEVIRRKEFVIPPSVTDLCLQLGITRQTWANYAASEECAPVVEWAKAQMQGYLERELLTRTKGLQGVIFNLQNNYDWKERREVEAGPQTRKELSAASVPLGEKLALLEELFRSEKAAEEQDGEVEEEDA